MLSLCILLRSFCWSGEIQYADMLECKTSLLHLITASFIEKNVRLFLAYLSRHSFNFHLAYNLTCFPFHLLGRYPDNHDRYTKYFL